MLVLTGTSQRANALLHGTSGKKSSRTRRRVAQDEGHRPEVPSSKDWEKTVKLLRRQFLQFAGAAAVGSALPQLASALDYPTRPVRIIVGFPAGNASDIIVRLVAAVGTRRRYGWTK